MCRDNVTTHNALFMRTCCIGRKRQWPLILDPNDQVAHWVKLLQEREMVGFHEEDESADIDDDSPGKFITCNLILGVAIWTKHL